MLVPHGQLAVFGPEHNAPQMPLEGSPIRLQTVAQARRLWSLLYLELFSQCEWRMPVGLSELAVKGSDGNGSTIACKSACAALNQPQYYCTGAFNTPETFPSTNYSKIFKD
ncbi:hypothetical protein LWI29_036645 [Acer saccharum]|uniref:Uncharacterized protein n=1 Tax=Acer saccharum TaxID=4024 RepID=A0AA39SZU8_ACESA|nr:hypothetical protein LWI29_036645 [Acer saccharum]